VDVPKPKALALKAALHAGHLLEATDLPAYSKALVSQVRTGSVCFCVMHVWGMHAHA